MKIFWFIKRTLEVILIYNENPANWIKTTKPNCNKFAINVYIVMYKINKKHSQVLTYTWDGFDKHWQENRAQQGSGHDTQFEAVKLPISGYKRGMQGCASILVVSICLLYAYTNRNYQYISNPGLVYHN